MDMRKLSTNCKSTENIEEDLVRHSRSGVQRRHSVGAFCRKALPQIHRSASDGGGIGLKEFRLHEGDLSPRQNSQIPVYGRQKNAGRKYSFGQNEKPNLELLSNTAISTNELSDKPALAPLFETINPKVSRGLFNRAEKKHSLVLNEEQSSELLQDMSRLNTHCDETTQSFGRHQSAAGANQKTSLCWNENTTTSMNRGIGEEEKDCQGAEREVSSSSSEGSNLNSNEVSESLKPSGSDKNRMRPKSALRAGRKVSDGGKKGGANSLQQRGQPNFTLNDMRGKLFRFQAFSHEEPARSCCDSVSIACSSFVGPQGFLPELDRPQPKEVVFAKMKDIDEWLKGL